MEEQINFTEIILNSINELFSMIFSSIDNTIYSTLDNLTFISKDILYDGNFQKIASFLDLLFTIQ